MKRLFLLLAAFSLVALSSAQENKISYKFGGNIEFKSYFDDYRSKTSRYDLQYNYPLQPAFNSSGADVNKSNSVNFTIFASRLSFKVSGLQLLNADVSSYIETDFLGSTESAVGMLNLRHAYMNFNWNKSSLLIGQSNHLTYVDEVSPGVVAFGSGYPFNTLCRGVQVRYSQKLAENVNFLASALMYSSHKPVGPANAQVQAGLPDLHAQLKFGDPDKFFGGVTVGYKLFKPRTTDALKNPVSTTVGAYDVSAFLKLAMSGGHSLKLWGIYGENLTMYNMTGGYGKISDNPGIPNDPDYKYDNIRTLSIWGDFETPAYKNFKLGFFYGYQKNYGTSEEMDVAKNNAGEYVYGYYKDANLEWFTRLSPRIQYTLAKKLIFALEYNLTYAQWVKNMDSKLTAVEKYPANHNNRIELMAKLNF